MANSSKWKDAMAVVGSIFTVIGAAASVISIIPDDWLKGTFIERSKAQIATALLPTGYIVVPDQVPKVQKGSGFALDDGQSILLARDSGPPDSIGVGYWNPITGMVKVNGKVYEMNAGDTAPTSDPNCSVIFVSITESFSGKGRYNFIYRC